MRRLVTRWLSRAGGANANEDGSTLVVVALLLVGLFGCAAIAIDVGTLYYEKQTAQAAADAGALAGASQLVQGPSAQQSAQAAQTEAKQIAVQNDPNVTYTITVNPQNTAVTVTGQQIQQVWFAKVLGQTQATIHVSSTAAIGPLTSMTGVVPIGVPNQAFSYGQQVNLSEGAGNGQSGNYGYLDFGSLPTSENSNANGNGADLLGYYIQNGYDQPLKIGDTPDTKTGENVGKVQSAINYRMTPSADPSCNSFQTVHNGCLRLLYLPVIDSFNVNGHKPVTVVGFAAFYLEGFTGSNGNGNQQLQGEFIKMIHPGTIGSSPGYGTYGVKLTGS